MRREEKITKRFNHNTRFPWFGKIAYYVHTYQTHPLFVLVHSFVLQHTSTLKRGVVDTAKASKTLA